MTVLLKAFFPHHNPPELAPAAPQGVGAVCACVCLFAAAGVRGSIHVRGGDPWNGAVLWIATFPQGQSDKCIK